MRFGCLISDTEAVTDERTTGWRIGGLYPYIDVLEGVEDGDQHDSGIRYYHELSTGMYRCVILLVVNFSNQHISMSLLA